MKKKIVIVGGGVSGLTGALYLLRKGFYVTILERTPFTGGLVSSFEKDGFLFDTGPRAFGNAGILKPMLEDLNIELPLIRGAVSTGIKDRVIHYQSNKNIEEYISSLELFFPENIKEIGIIHKHIIKNSKMVRCLNRIPNPFFKNIFKEYKYLLFKLLPWLPSFIIVLIKTSFFNKPVEKVLNSITKNGSLRDIVAQHFFKGTPSSFALGYFENFLDYQYPLGGTKMLADSLVDKIISQGGVIIKNCDVIKVDPIRQLLTSREGVNYSYDKMLWTADLKSLYSYLDCSSCIPRLERKINRRKEIIFKKKPGESVFSIFIAVDLPHEYFGNISNGHFIYTPNLRGLGEMKSGFTFTSKLEMNTWLENFCKYNTYEISIPVLKDKTLAPEHKTGLIVSILVDGELFENAMEGGFYEDFKERMRDYMIDTLEESIYPGLKSKIIFNISSTPLTLINMFHNSKGAITGWSLEEKAPVPNGLLGIFSSVKTVIPNVYKSGQWSFSPSGVPISILTGRVAAKIIK